MNLNQILENHTQAIGGKSAVEGLKTLRVDFHLAEPTFEADGVYLADRRGKMRVDIFMQKKRVFSEGHNGTQGWQWHQDAEHGIPASPEGSKALLHGIERQISGLHELPPRGHRLEFKHREMVDNVEYAVLIWENPDGQTQWCFINTLNWQLERRREWKALHVDIDPTKVITETVFSDFRRVEGGLLRPFHETQTNLTTGKLMQTTVITDLLINPSFEPGLFEIP